MEAETGGLILGGLYREWMHQTTGEVKISCSVITLPPHDKLKLKLKHIHSKAMPFAARTNIIGKVVRSDV